MKYFGRSIHPGNAQGVLLVSQMGISFFGGIDTDTGIVVEHGHDLYGQSVSGKILAFPKGKGSTVGSYSLYRLKKSGLAPLAIINHECETIIAVGCIISDIPCIDQINLQLLKSGEHCIVNSEKGYVDILESYHT